MVANPRDDLPDEEPPTALESLRRVVGWSPESAQPDPLPVTRFERVHVIVNPASGRDTDSLSLPTLNRVLQRLQLDWDLSVTRGIGDARELAAGAVADGADVVAVFGGDGTVLEVARGVFGSGVPIALLPGGTANVLAVELGIPSDLTSAALLLGGSPNAVKPVDMGWLQDVPADAHGGERLFFHLGVGAEGRIHEVAGRDAKDRSGMLAYVIATVRAFTNPKVSRYHLTLDGESLEVDGINCMITTYGALGVGGITFSRSIDVGDGLLDVILMENTNVGSVLSAASSVVATGELTGGIRIWKAREISVRVDPVQPVVVDGERTELETVNVRVAPNAVQVVVPAGNE